jgi:outer membrane protein OmpA-like peptidoglycan-associated protein
MNNLQLTILLSGVSLMTACATAPQNLAMVDQLQVQYDSLARSGDARKYAPVALNEAQSSLNQTQALVAERVPLEDITLSAEITKHKLGIVEEKVRKGRAEALVRGAELKRKDIMLDARTNEAQKAELNAQQALLAAEMANDQTRSMQARAQQAEQRAQKMEAKAAKLEQEVTAISAKKTDRGLVLTLGDILFEFGKAQLLSGSERSLKQVGEFLTSYPDRTIVVEGHTDSVGDASFNQNLSEQRALSVKNALITNGVATGQIKSKGLGEEFPVANNGTDAGRQQNRRVEIIVENPDE